MGTSNYACTSSCCQDPLLVHNCSLEEFRMHAALATAQPVCFHFPFIINTSGVVLPSETRQCVGDRPKQCSSTYISSTLTRVSLPTGMRTAPGAGNQPVCHPEAVSDPGVPIASRARAASPMLPHSLLCFSGCLPCCTCPVASNVSLKLAHAGYRKTAYGSSKRTTYRSGLVDLIVGWSSSSKRRRGTC